MTALFTLGLLACAPARSETPPPPAAEAFVSHNPDPTQRAAEEAAAAFGVTRLGFAPNRVEATVFGLASGYPEVKITDPQAPMKPGRAVLVRQGQVLEGPEGFKAFVAAEGKTDAVRTAVAACVLGLGMTIEPMLPNPYNPRPGPTWNGDSLVFFAGSGHGVSRFEVRIDPDGALRVVSTTPAG